MIKATDATNNWKFLPHRTTRQVERFLSNLLGSRYQPLPEHRELLPIFGAFVFINVGLPLLFIFLCYKALQAKLMNTPHLATTEQHRSLDSFQERYKFLWSDYRFGCSFFILFLLVKDSFLPLSGILFDDGFRQGIFAALVLTVYVFSVAHFSPYRFAYLNKLECSLVVFQVAILLVAGFSFDRTEGQAPAILSPLGLEKEDRQNFRNRRTSFVLLALQIGAWLLPFYLSAGGAALNALVGLPDADLASLLVSTKSEFQNNEEAPLPPKNDAQLKVVLGHFISKLRPYIIGGARRFCFPGLETPDELRDEILQYVFILSGPDHLQKWIARLARRRTDHQQLRWIQRGLKEILVAGFGSSQGHLQVLRKSLKASQHGRHVSFPARRIDTTDSVLEKIQRIYYLRGGDGEEDYSKYVHPAEEDPLTKDEMGSSAACAPEKLLKPDKFPSER